VQVYASGLLKRQALVLRVLDEAVRLRGRLAAVRFRRRLGEAGEGSEPSEQVSAGVAVAAGSGASFTQPLGEAAEETGEQRDSGGSYASMLLEGSLVGTPAAACSFLRQFASALRPHARADVAALEARAVPWEHPLSTTASGRGLAGSPQGISAGFFPEESSSAFGGGGEEEEEEEEGQEGKRAQGRGGVHRGGEPSPSLEGWNVDFLLSQAAQEGRRGPGGSGEGSWKDYSDYFTVESILEVGRRRMLPRLGPWTLRSRGSKAPSRESLGVPHNSFAL
jgi:hypothetical protein